MAQLIVNVDVNDLERAVRFYTSALGLRVGRRFGSEVAELLGAETSIYLLLAAEGTTPFARQDPAASTPGQGSAARDYRRHWTPVHLDFAVDDLDASVEQALAAGARLELPISQRKWGRLAVLADPFGHGFCLLQFVGRGYDELATSSG